jgi:hypothetical protein
VQGLQRLDLGHRGGGGYSTRPIDPAAPGRVTAADVSGGRWKGPLRSGFWLPKTTVYYWIKDLPLGRERRWSDGQRKGKTRRCRGSSWSCATPRTRAGVAEYDDLIQVSQFRDFVVLYIAEGYKRSRNRVAVGNAVVVNDTYFRSRLQAWIDRIKDDWALDFGV